MLREPEGVSSLKQIISSPAKHLPSIPCSFWRTEPYGKIESLNKIRKMYTSLSKALHALSMNICTFTAVVLESLGCPQCVKTDLRIIQSQLERVRINRRCWKTKVCTEGVSWRTAERLDEQQTHKLLSKQSLITDSELCKKHIHSAICFVDCM